MNYKKIALAIGVLLLLVITGFIIWASFPLGPMSAAEDALQSNDEVTVTIDEFITFTPVNIEPDTGLIFYPGGRVAEESYAPLAQMIARQGFLVVIVPMTLHLAVFSPDKATDVIDTYTSISTWTIAGHSLGGAMAASFVYNNPDTVEALFLLAAYPAENEDLSDRDLVVVTIYGTNDEVLSEDIEDTLVRLPSTTTVVAIEGGNHAYFGYYGEQNGDGEATISREEQHNITTSAIITSLVNL